MIQPASSHHITPTQFTRSATLGTFIGISGYWMVAYLIPAIHDLARFIITRL